MKKFLSLVVLAGLVYFGAQFNAARHRDEPFEPSHKTSYQAKTSHLLALVNEGEIHGHCTATAVGPHALLTADHCLEGKPDAVKLDLSRRTYTITKILRDHNEHVVIIVDGPVFAAIQPFKFRDAKIGEHEFYYGNGGLAYPADCKSGIVVDQYDPSDLDKDAGVRWYSNGSIPGDSGSAVYGDDGSILTLVTMHFTEESLLTSKSLMVGYSLRFTPAQVLEAQDFKTVGERDSFILLKR